MNPHLQRAQLLIEQHRCADAERELGMALGKNPDDAWAHVLLAVCLADRRAYNEASARGKQAIGLAPDSATIRRIAADVEYSRDAYDDAERLYDEAIQLDPHDTQSFSGRAAVHAGRKHWKMALEDVERALELDPENLEAINIRSLANRGLGLSGDGYHDVQYALRVDPNDARSHANLGWSHLERGELDKAQEHFREALRIDPSLEWARVGVLETTKARFPLYRWVLNYFLWMAKLTGQAQMAIIVGLFVVNRLVRGAAEAHPDWAPVLLPITWVYVLFCVATWFIQPLGNATLLLHPFARMALSRKEKTEAIVVGGLFVVVLALIIGSFFDESGVCFVLAAGIGIAGLPVAMTFRFEHPKPRRIMQWIAAAVALSAPAGVYMLASAEGLAPEPPEIPRNLFGLLAGVFVLATGLFFAVSPLVVLITTNVLLVKRWRRD